MVATVVELWRYPVKSLLGEAMDEVEVEERGVVGNRLYAVTDRQGKLGSGKMSRRFRRLDGLFELRARLAGEQPLVTLPDGRDLATDDPELDAFLSDRYEDELRVTREAPCPITTPHRFICSPRRRSSGSRRNCPHRRSTATGSARTFSSTVEPKG